MAEWILKGVDDNGTTWKCSHCGFEVNEPTYNLDMKDFQEAGDYLNCSQCKEIMKIEGDTPITNENIKLRLILKGLQRTNKNEWTTVYKTVEVYAPYANYNTDWFVVGAEVVK